MLKYKNICMVMLKLLIEFVFLHTVNIKRKLKYMAKQILVTGGTGYIGSHTVVELQEKGFDVVIVDNLSNSQIEVLDNIEKITGIRPAFEKFDLSERDKTYAFL